MVSPRVLLVCGPCHLVSGQDCSTPSECSRHAECALLAVDAAMERSVPYALLVDVGRPRSCFARQQQPLPLDSRRRRTRINSGSSATPSLATPSLFRRHGSALCRHGRHAPSLSRRLAQSAMTSPHGWPVWLIGRLSKRTWLGGRAYSCTRVSSSWSRVLRASAD